MDWNRQAKATSQRIKDILHLQLERTRASKQTDIRKVDQLDSRIQAEFEGCRSQIASLEAELNEAENKTTVPSSVIRQMETTLLSLTEELHKVESAESAPQQPRPQQRQSEPQLVSFSNIEEVDDYNQNQLVMRQQDSQLDQLHSVVVNQKNIGFAISEELDTQAIMLDRLDQNTDGTQERLSYAQRRLNRIYEAGKGNWFFCIMAALIVIVVLLIILK